jgi:hypothetical protein
MISRKCTSTLHSSRSGKFAEMWMSSDILPCLIFEARYPNTNKRASMVLDFPDPLGPTMEENDWDSKKKGQLKFVGGCLNINYLVERPDLLPSGITFEINQNHFVDY